MTKKEFKIRLSKYVVKYKQICNDSIKTDNPGIWEELKNENNKIDEQSSRCILNNFTKFVCSMYIERNNLLAIDMINFIKKCAKTFHNDSKILPKINNQKLINVILVNFINYVAYDYRIDQAMHICDLKI